MGRKRSWMILLSLLLCCLPAICHAEEAPVVTLTGLVRHPQRLTLEDLAHYRTVSVRTTEVDSSGAFHGVYNYQGVPLQYLLQAAGVAKEGGEFAKAIDLAVEVRNRRGERALLSWAEVAYGRPADVVVAFAATSLLAKDAAPPLPALPRLVLGNDFYSDRSLADVVAIEVIDPAARAEITPLALPRAAQVPAAEVAVKIVRNGGRFDGVRRFAGTPLVEVLRRAGVRPDARDAILVRSRDGYRSLLSCGELFWSPLGERILLADRLDGRPLGEGGERWLVLPDASAMRYVRNVAGIEWVRLRHQAKLTVIGVGPGDTSLMTLQALSALARADAVAAPGDIQKRFARYLTGKEILFDPFDRAKPDRAKPLSRAERERLQKEEWRAHAAKIRQTLEAGRDVAFLDWGDPLIFGSSRWIRDYFDEGRIETVASLSAFNAANAVINRDVSANGAVVITSPRDLRRNPALLAAVAKHGETLAIFMGLRELPDLVPLLGRHYDAATPVRLVYAAGISGREHLVATTLEKTLQAAAGEKEPFLGLIYLGPCLAQGRKTCN